MRVLMLVASLAALAPHAVARAQPASSPPSITLDELEQLALRNNPTTAVAAAGVEAARARTQQAGAWPNPVIGYSGAELQAGVSERRGEHGFFVEQVIPLAGKLRLSRDAARKTIAQAEAFGDVQRLRILSSVRQAFYAVLLAERRIEVQQRLAALASEAVGVTAQLFNVGAADRPDYLEIEIEARRAQLQLAGTRNDLDAFRHQLAALAGVRGVAARPLAGSIDTAVPELQRDQVVQTLLERSPALRAARLELERTRALTARAVREPFPDVFLRGGAEYNRERGERPGRPIGWQGTAEAGISLPLFNRNAGGIAAARADEARAQADVARLELSLESRAVSAFARYLTARRAAEAYRSDILPRAEEAYRLYLARYREMAAAYPQVLVAQRTLFEMSEEYLDHLQQAWRGALSLQGLLAGDGLDAPSLATEANASGTEDRR
jgi:cobalt-zinc-cadmium efflux system outer membrane protein